MILALRTDKPEAELYLLKDGKEQQALLWQAHLELSRTIHIKIGELLKMAQLEYKDLHGIIVYRGPGSFTGLRIGVSVANAMAEGLGIPIVGASGPEWLSSGAAGLQTATKPQIIMPEYGSEPHISQPRK